MEVLLTAAVRVNRTVTFMQLLEHETFGIQLQITFGLNAQNATRSRKGGSFFTREEIRKIKNRKNGK